MNRREPVVIVTILTAGRSKKALTEEIFSGSAPSGAGAFRSSAGLSIFSFLMICTFSLCGSSSVSSCISSICIFCPFPVFSPAFGGSCSASGGICSVSVLIHKGKGRLCVPVERKMIFVIPEENWGMDGAEDC